MRARSDLFRKIQPSTKVRIVLQQRSQFRSCRGAPDHHTCLEERYTIPIEWSNNERGRHDTPMMPTDFSDFSIALHFSTHDGFDVSSSSAVIAKLACQMIPRDTVVELIAHMLALSEENVHESTQLYLTKKYRLCPNQ